MLFRSPYRVFISEDPIGLAGGINQFAYVGNNPLNRVDPLGLGPNSECSYYAEKCYEGDAYACFAYDACMGGNPLWGGPNSERNQCVRGCLLEKYKAGCKDPVCYAEHKECFKKCENKSCK